MLTSVLSKEQIDKVHQTSLNILENVGVMMPHKEVLSRFADCGAAVDLKRQQVKIPAHLVSKLLSKAGKSFTLYGRDISKKAEFGLGKRNYNSVAGEAFWVDDMGNKRRYATLDNVTTAARFADALDQINITGAMSDPHELSVDWRCVAVVAEMIKNTLKPITFWFHNRSSAKYINELLIVLRGNLEKAAEFPLCYPFLEPISPLHFPFDGVDLLFETSRLNLPVFIGPMAQMGMSSPATISGTMAMENAEILAGICVTQLIREGMPVCYGGICHAFDMGTTQMIFAGPEQAIFGVAMTQMGKYYGLPVYINAGLTDAKCVDAQAGLEIGITIALGAAAGADIFGHMGICVVDQASSLDMLALQNEIISYVESINRNIDFSNEAIGFELIEEIGHKGTFIDKDHTVNHFRNELWFPKLLDRNYYNIWLKGGAASMEQRCQKRKYEILSQHVVPPLAKDIEKEVEKIVSAAKTNLSVMKVNK